MKKINLTGAVILTLAFFAGGSSASITKPFILRSDKKKMVVSLLEANAEGVLTYKIKDFSSKIKPEGYIYARAPMPGDVKNASRKFRAGQYKDAAKAFKEAYKTKRFLGWGAYCIYYAAKALIKAQKQGDAINTLEILKDFPLDPEDLKYFLKAKKLEADILIKEKKLDKVVKILDLLSKGNDQATAMFANNTKGDLLSAQGKDNEALYMYMRNILLYNPDKSTESIKAIKRVVEILKAQNNPRAAEYEAMLH